MALNLNDSKKALKYQRMDSQGKYISLIKKILVMHQVTLPIRYLRA
jgi:hypothetical protein